MPFWGDFNPGRVCPWDSHWYFSTEYVLVPTCSLTLHMIFLNFNFQIHSDSRWLAKSVQENLPTPHSSLLSETFPGILCHDVNISSPNSMYFGSLSDKEHATYAFKCPYLNSHPNVKPEHMKLEGCSFISASFQTTVEIKGSRVMTWWMLCAGSSQRRCWHPEEGAVRRGGMAQGTEAAGWLKERKRTWGDMILTPSHDHTVMSLGEGLQ